MTTDGPGLAKLPVVAVAAAAVVVARRGVAVSPGMVEEDSWDGGPSFPPKRWRVGGLGDPAVLAAKAAKLSPPPPEKRPYPEARLNNAVWVKVTPPNDRPNPTVAFSKPPKWRSGHRGGQGEGKWGAVTAVVRSPSAALAHQPASVARGGLARGRGAEGNHTRRVSPVKGMEEMFGEMLPCGTGLALIVTHRWETFKSKENMAQKKRFGGGNNGKAMGLAFFFKENPRNRGLSKNKFC